MKRNERNSRKKKKKEYNYNNVPICSMLFAT